jgi:uroporphyrinogen decarboxylase
MLKNDLLLRAARREQTERTPVWLMRQAGRFDPRYREIRAQADLPLEELFCRPDEAVEISLLPKRLGVDAIIVFQDILTPLAPMGKRFLFRPGPVLEQPVRCAGDSEALRVFDPCEKLDFVAKTLRLVRAELDGDLPLLGFAGAPLTLAMFLTAGQSPHLDATLARSMMTADPASFHRLLDRLADMTVHYLSMQIEAGADAVQLFESAADLVSPEEYAEFALPYHTKIFSALGPGVPAILFAKDQPAVAKMVDSGADVLSVASCVDLDEAARRFGHRVAFQGNVDNRILHRGSLEEIDEAVHACVRAGRHKGHILNLGHGVLKDTPFENVCRFIETAKKVRAPVGN